MARYYVLVDCTPNLRSLSLLLLFTAQALCAQEFSFRTFGNSDGLNNLAVRQIYQDRAGFIWVSTENGIFRYDGDRFESFGPAEGIPISSAAAFGEAPDGSLLAGGSFGLYHLRGNSFEQLPVSFKTVSWSQGIQSDGNGHTYLGTDSGLIELHSEPGRVGFAEHKFPQVATSGPSVDAVLVDGAILWYGCGQQLCRADQDGTRVFGLESGLLDSPLMVIRKDREGNLWVRARNAGVLVLFAGQTKFRRPSSPLRVSPVGIPSIDAFGRILIPSPDGLLIGDGKTWQKVDHSLGLRGAVYSVFEDRQGSLWIGLAGRGLTQWRGYHEWKSYSTASGLASDIVYEIQPQSDGTLWVGTEGGLLQGVRRQSGIRWKKVAGLDQFPVHSVRLASDGDLWIGTESHGAAHFHVRTGTVEWFGEAQGLLGKSPYTLRLDHRQRLWAATEAGLFVAAAPYQRFARVAELPANRMWAVAEGVDGVVWAGGTDGLFAYTNGHWKNFTRSNGLSNQEVLALGAGPNGEIWIGYRFGGGIDRVHLQADGLAVEKGVQRAGTDGLVYFLDFDSSGRLWAGTEWGVDLWNGSRWSHYDISDGLAWNDCDLNGFAQESDGTVWIGTSGGLSEFKPAPRLVPEEPIQVVFTRLVMGGADVSWRTNPSFGAHANSLVARYSALNVSTEHRILFRYRLNGSNSTWTETAQRELQFAELAPGAYRLEIEAQAKDGTWSGNKAEFAFRILTPWYRSWWFVSACILVPLLASASLVRLRIEGARRRQVEISAWKERYDAAVLASGQIIYDWDPSTNEVTFGGALEKVLGYLPEEFHSMKRRWREMIHPEDLAAYDDAMEQAIETTAPFELEYRVRGKDGKYRTVREQGRMALGHGGELNRMVGFLADVTEQRILERQLRQSQKMQAVGRLAGGVAHDFNNLLTIITGYSAMQLDRTPPSDPVHREAEQIKAAADRAAALTRQLLAFSRQQVLLPRRVNLNDIVRNIDKMLRRLIGEDIEVLSALAPDLGTVMADPGQMDQVLMNLVVNARDAMPDGGKLTIQTENVELDKEYVRRRKYVKAGSYVLLAVTDSGTGMTADTQAHLFEPFFTTKEAGRGTGLGLSMVYGIVKQSGGSIDVYSEVNHGTSVRIYLPRLDQPVENVAAATVEDSARSQGSERILLVEDDVLLRGLVVNILTTQGYVVRTVEDVEELDAIVQQTAQCDLLLTDVVMPKMNGPELAKRVAQRWPGIKVLYMSGYTTNAIVHHGVLDEGLSFLPKPFTPAALAAKVREVLDGASRSKSLS